MILKMHKKLPAAIVILLAMHAPVFAQSSADIVGVTIGMTADQAREALKKSGTPFKFIEGRYKAETGIPESLAYINACVAIIPPSETRCVNGIGGSGSDQVLVAFGQMSGKVFSVQRFWEPAKAALPMMENVEKAVLEKYTGLKKFSESSSGGKPSGRSYSYTSDLNNRPADQCTLNTMTGIPNSAKSNCGFSAAASFNFEGELQKLTKLQIGIFDHRVLLADIKQSREIQSAAANKQKASEEGAARKVTGPKL